MKNIILILLISFFFKSSFAQQNTKSISTILRLKWVDSLDNWKFTDFYPLICKNDLVPFNSTENIYEISSKKKIHSVDKLLCREIVSKRKYIVFENLFKTEVLSLRDTSFIFKLPKKKKSIYNGYVSPFFIDDTTHYFVLDRNTLIKMDFVHKRINWKFNSISGIYTQPVLYKSKIHEEVVFCNLNTLFILDVDKGEEKWHLILGNETISKLELIDNYAYVWSKGKGLVAIDLDKRQIAWNFYAINQAQEKNQYNLLIEGDTIFFVSGDVYAVNRLTGELIWKTNHNCASHASSMDVGITKKYVLYYDHCAESFPLLTAVNKQTGKVEYQEFTSELYPPDDETGLSDLDIRNFSFVRGMYKNYKIAIYMDKIYCFEVLE